MFRVLNLLLVMVFLTPSVGLAKKRVLLMIAGGGEDKPDQNISHEAVLTALQATGQVEEEWDRVVDSWMANPVRRATLPKRNKWDLRLLYDGNQPNLKKEVEKVSGLPVQPVSQSAIEAQIKKLLKEADQYKEGDQVMLAIDGHGVVTEGNYLVATQKKGFGLAILPLLKKLRDKLEAKGARLAILGDTCFSGQLLELASPKTCVVTSTTPNHMGYATENFLGLKIKPLSFLTMMLHSLEPGMSVDALFREARTPYLGNMVDALNFPQISTPAGLRTFERLSEIYEQSWTSLDYTGLNGTPLAGLACLEEAPPSDHFLNGLHALVPSASPLEAKLDLILSRILGPARPAQMKGALHQIKELFAQKEALRVQGRYALERAKAHLDSTDVALALANEDQFSSLAGQGLTEEQIQNLKKEQKKLHESSKFQRVREDLLELTKLPSKIQKIEKKIGEQEKTLYDAVYEISEVDTTGPNPCAEFKF